MSLFNSRKPEPTEANYRGGCAEHQMRGPYRKTFDKANKDATDHGRRMHGNPAHPNLYIEGR
jgi:hypothetical protein